MTTMTLGTVRECTIAGLTLKTQSDGDVKVRKEGVMTTTIMAGSGATLRSGEFQSGKVVIPCILNLTDLVRLQEKIDKTPDEGYPCTFTLVNGEVWGFEGSIDSELDVSLKEGKVDLEFTAMGIRRL